MSTIENLPTEQGGEVEILRKQLASAIKSEQALTELQNRTSALVGHLEDQGVLGDIGEAAHEALTRLNEALT